MRTSSGRFVGRIRRSCSTIGSLHGMIFGGGELYLASWLGFYRKVPDLKWIRESCANTSMVQQKVGNEGRIERYGALIIVRS